MLFEAGAKLSAPPLLVRARSATAFCKARLGCFLPQNPVGPAAWGVSFSCIVYLSLFASAVVQRLRSCRDCGRAGTAVAQRGSLSVLFGFSLFNGFSDFFNGDEFKLHV